MSSRLLVLCACLRVLSIVAASDIPHGNDGDCVSDGNKSAVPVRSPEVEESFEDGTSRASVDSEDNQQADETLRSAWLNIPLLPIAYATSSSMPDGPCKKQAQRYLRDLKNETLWATEMYDASTKYPYGILSGHTRHLGDFDLCYNLRTTLPSKGDEDSLAGEEISGRYCLVDIEYEKPGLPPIDPSARIDLQFDKQGSVWEAVRERGDFRRVQRYRLQMALCVPEVCTAADVEAALRAPFARASREQNVRFEISVEPHFSQALKDAPKFPLAAKIYCALLFGLLSLVVLGTWYDYSLKEYKEDDGSVGNDLVLCFSARRNFHTIMDITSVQPGLDTIHVTRFFYLSLTMIGHRFVEYFAAPVVNIARIERVMCYMLSVSLGLLQASMMIFGGPQVVEGFFSVGGLLVSYNLLGEFDKKKRLDFLGAIVMRFLRLTPTHALLIFFSMLVLPYMGSGPYWVWKVGQERDNCANNWWANLLYINNYVNPDKLCMFQTWYLAVDYQLFMLAILVTYVFWRMPRRTGYPFLCSIILGGCILPFVNTYWFGVQPVWKGLPYMREVREDPYFTDHYVKTHERITSYFIGVLAGAILYDQNRKPWRLNKVASHALFILFPVLMSFGSQLTGHKFFDPNQNPKGFGAALHACLHRGAFAISCVSVPLLITMGQGLTFHYNFLTARWIQPLARISYGAYLVHTLIQLHDVGVTRIARQFSIQSMFWNVIPDVVYSFLLALLLSLVVEGPFRRIEKRFIMKRAKVEPSNGVKTEVKKTN